MPCAGVAGRPGPQQEAARSRSAARAAGFRLCRCDILLQCGPTGSARSRPAGVTYPPACRRDLGADRHAERDARGGRGAGIVRVRAGHRDRQPGQVGRCSRSSPGAAAACAHAAHLGGTGAARIGRRGDGGAAYRRAADFWFCPGWGSGDQRRAPGARIGRWIRGSRWRSGYLRRCSRPSCPASAWLPTRPCSRPPRHPPRWTTWRCWCLRGTAMPPPRPRSPPRGWPGQRWSTVRGDDPRADPGVIAALSAARPQRVLAVGSGFGTASQFASRIAVAETGVQLPGGGQVLFPRTCWSLSTVTRRALARRSWPAGPEGRRRAGRAPAAAYRHLSNARVVPSPRDHCHRRSGQPRPGRRVLL